MTQAEVEDLVLKLNKIEVSMGFPGPADGGRQRRGLGRGGSRGQRGRHA